MSGTRLARLITRRLYFASAALSTYPDGLFPVTDAEVNHADHVGNACEVVESSRSAALSADQAVRFQINSASDGEPGFCGHRWLREQQRQKNRRVLRPEAGHPNLRMHLDWGC